MNAASDLFDVPASPPEPNLVERASWQALREDSRGRPLDNVIISWCGRYTIVRSVHRDLESPWFVAFRRRGKPERERWDPPDVLGGYPTAMAARRACAEHQAREAAA